MNNSIDELVINYHVTEVCNYSCKFCYAKWDRPNEIHANGQDAELMLEKLASYFFDDNTNQVKSVFPYKSVRINFAGGEPLILKKRFAQLIIKTKSLGFNLSLITNGHYLTDSFINNYGAMFSMIGISFDSQYLTARKDIGRIDRKGKSFGSHDLIKVVTQLRNVNPSITIKVNTVVNNLNFQESFEELIAEIKPEKWKVFQVLPVLNNNLLVSDEQFSGFVKRHASLKEVMVAEDNEAMTNSYLMINPQGRFYQNSANQNGYVYGDLILDVGVEQALEVCEINWETFTSRYKKDNTVSLISNSEYQLKNNAACKQGALA
ncbi:viperin family antiviral radical SAM protein [Pseudoalteromonas sp. SIMBA_162]|jgi:radical S-adenosyl methionine domain-containing protein 2|uniref:viperin family antiviral radical SAM protein n=1 Tax=Pseudoalteromonas sp. SIMBA_162 TaxID=3080867 RepID=UPI003979A5C2